MNQNKSARSYGKPLSVNTCERAKNGYCILTEPPLVFGTLFNEEKGAKSAKQEIHK